MKSRAALAMHIQRFILATLLANTSVVLSAPQAFEQYSVLAALTLNFARFTQWPEPTFVQSGEKLQVCVVGDNVVQDAFAAINGKNVGKNTIEVVNASRLRNLNECHMIFISELPKNLLTQVFLDTKNRPVLTLGEDVDFVETGGMVGMLNVESKINLTVNLPVVKTSGLNISSNLLKLVKIVDETGKAP